MLFGEHAVLHGHLALVGAVSQRLRVTLTPHAGSAIRISLRAGRVRIRPARPRALPTFRFMVAALRVFADDLPSGFDLQVESEFPPPSASAPPPPSPWPPWARCCTGRAGRAGRPGLQHRPPLIRDVQGAGSGADVAASVHGGLVLYRADPLEIEPLAHTHPLTAVYSGSKLATPLVIALVEERRRSTRRSTPRCSTPWTSAP
jgi:mevalonate kinase